METDKDKTARISTGRFLQQVDEERVLFATIERVATSEQDLKVTPWLQGTGCLCRLAFMIPLTAVEVSRTEWTSECCGRRLPVVQIHFASTHAPVQQVILSQLDSFLRLKQDPGDGPGPSDCESECAWRRRACVQAVLNHVPEQHQERALQHCADNYSSCIEGCADIGRMARSIRAPAARARTR